MWGLAPRLWRALRSWEGPHRWAAFTALGILALAFLAIFIGPHSLRIPAFVGALGALVALQLLVMWSLRGLQTAASLAQQAFQQGDYERCCQLLAADDRLPGGTSPSQQTLLALAYRQRGMLAESESLLRSLTVAEPIYPPAWRALGLTLLAQGDYSAAERALDQAQGAAIDWQVELGLTEHLAGEVARAQPRFRAALAKGNLSESHAWLARHLCGEEGSAAGRNYWLDEARRFAETDYGVRLAVLLDTVADTDPTGP